MMSTTMKSLPLQTAVEFKLFVRDPGSAFFALLFPLILLVANNSISGDEGVSTDEAMIGVPMLISMVAGMIGLAIIPATIADYRQNGVLRRLMATPNSPVSLLVANAIAQLAMALVAMVLLVSAGVALYGAELPSNPVLFVGVWLLGAMSLAACGFLVAALAPTARTATAMGFGLFFPMLYLSGAMMPRESLPESVATVGDYTPMGPVTQSLRDVWEGTAPQPLMLLAMAGILVAASGIAARAFRF